MSYQLVWPRSGALRWSQDGHRCAVVKVNIRLHSLSPGALPALHTPVGGPKEIFVDAAARTRHAYARVRE
eukprot:4757080-Prymnesium_polylepis.2